MTKKYYSLWCKQNGGYMNSGLNSESLEDLHEALLSYISVDYSEEDEDWQSIQKMSVQELAGMWSFRIDEHAKKIPESF